MCVSVDRFVFLSGLVDLQGFIGETPWPVRSVRLLVDGRPAASGKLFEAPSTRTRFQVRAVTDLSAEDFKNVALELRGGWGRRLVVTDLGRAERRALAGHALLPAFLGELREQPGEVLEIGSRARSGVTRRHLIPEGCSYVGLDICEGENVDVVGDAHRLSALFAPGRFRAAMSLSVFEHLAMPWKVVVELARVLALGGTAYVQTHQTYPIHDAPWDFWRISSDAWPSLFNARTGFEIIAAANAEPALVVQHRWHPTVNHGEAVGWALSAVLVRKIGEPEVDWAVNPSELGHGNYPA